MLFLSSTSKSVTLNVAKLLSIIILCLSFSAHVLSQKFADKDFYLVDSLILEDISPEYQLMIKNSLSWYHAAKTDIERVGWVNQIVKKCWDDNVWPKYNQWVYDFSSVKLKEPLEDSVRLFMLQAKAGAVYYIGWAYGVKTEYNKCISYYEEGNDIYMEIGDSVGIANSLDNIGGIYYIKGEYAKALDYHIRGLKIRQGFDHTMDKQQNHNIAMGASYNSIGLLHLGHGDYEMALEEFKKSLSCNKKGNFTSGVSSSLTYLGTIEFFLGNYENSLSYHKESLEIKQMLEDKQGMANSFTHIGTISRLQGDFSVAITNYEKGIVLYEEIGDRRGYADVMNNLGHLHLQQEDFEKAVEYFQLSLEISKDIGASRVKRNALVGLFDTYILDADYVQAEKYILELTRVRLNDVKINFTVLPEKKKELYFKTMEEDFEKFHSYAALRQNNNPEVIDMAYDITLKLKGLLLKSSTAMREAILTSNDTDLIEKYNSWISLKKEIADIYAVGGDLSEKEEEANAIEKELMINSTAFNEINGTDDLKWQDIQAKLEQNEVAIEFIHYKTEIGNETSPIEYAALLIKNKSNHPVMISLGKESELEEILGTNQANNFGYINKIYGTLEAPNNQLYELIWQPIEEHLEGINKVNFSVSGLLHKISFSSLYDMNKVFLSDKYQLVQVGSTGQLLNNKPFEFSENSVASLFGGVNYSTDSTSHVIWNYLPGSLAEIDSINVTVRGKIDVHYFKNMEASEENFKEEVTSSNFIHIASHGYFYPDPDQVRETDKIELEEEELNFRGGTNKYGIWNFVNNKNPLMRSGIALAGANDMWDRSVFEEGEDGVLTAQEVATLNMRNTDLVVLSACETGLGDIRGNEGVYGLQRAFKMAGVRYIIMSLWQVPDAETAEFMSLFYKKLLIKRDVRLAFSDTQKEMRTKYDPYFWAAFVLIE
jgi:CHAT domain-containing protein